MTHVVRIKDIAEKAQVSTGTVDRVIHNRGRVAKEVREKVLQIIEELNYKPNLIARTLKSNRTYKLAALIPDPQIDSYWEAPKSGIERAEAELRQYGIIVEQFIFNPYSIDSFLKKAAAVTDSRPEGILLRRPLRFGGTQWSALADSVRSARARLSRASA